ncbi:MAG TPA: magnesium/cobalt transporter CorA [Candidatus Hodarchaeales archaeon]|nr:magnesium/cobalt transporter CorA [Candidatus Hodarchaeales archaeon]
MSKPLFKRSKKAGLPPESLVFIGEVKLEKPIITIFDYDEQVYEEFHNLKVEDCVPPKNGRVRWINVDGVSDVQVVSRIGQTFGIHPLLIEDILNTEQRPKVEEFPDLIAYSMNMLYSNGKATKDFHITSEHVSVIVGKNYVISFQERAGDVFDPLRDRIRTSKGRVRKSGSDYLSYVLLDLVIDNFFSILEKVGEVLEELEEDILSEQNRETISELHLFKRELIMLRKTTWPIREVVAKLERLEHPNIQKKTRIYFKDVHDHAIEVIDSVELYREIFADLIDTYHSSSSNRLNEVMKELTIISAIFLPLTFITSVFGMNFPEINLILPELGLGLGYYIVWAILFVMVFVMVIYFRRRKWL